MSWSRDVARVAALSAIIVGSDFALAPFPNVKLLDTVVFLAAYLFGFRVGATVAVISEFIWAVVSPWGPAGAITPFLVVGEVLFAAGGWWASRVWGGRPELLRGNAVFLGAIILICAFVWDLETNAATAVIALWPSLTLEKLLLVEAVGIPFAIIHEVADFVIGTALAPLTILLIPRVSKRELLT